MSTDNNNSGGGIGFLGLLAIVFIVLKLTGVIAWSWWWVTAPLWGGIALLFAIIALYGAYLLVKIIASKLAIMIE